MSLFREHPELLAAFREGRHDALEQVYRAYVRPLERNLRAMARACSASELAQASAVADLLQEVFVRAFSASARRAYDGLRDFGPYLATIARHCFVDALRTRGREVLRAPDDLRLDLERIEAAPSDDGAWGDPKTRLVLTSYVDELPPPLAGIYQERFVLGRSQEQASAALGLSRRAIRTGERKLRSGLRKALARAGVSLRELAAAPSPPRPSRA